MWINVVSACISAHCLRAFQQNRSAVEDTEGDLHNGTMTLVTCEDYRLLTTLENLSGPYDIWPIQIIQVVI
jgi:hypothetical protein